MKTKQFCPECDQFLGLLTAAMRRLFEVCSKVSEVVEREGRADTPQVQGLLVQSRAVMAECSKIRQDLQEHRSSGHAVDSSFEPRD